MRHWIEVATDLTVTRQHQKQKTLLLVLVLLELTGRRYDVKSVSPRHVEAILVDTLRLRDPNEVRRVLQGCPGLPDAATHQRAQQRERTPTQEKHRQAELDGDDSDGGNHGDDDFAGRRGKRKLGDDSGTDGSGCDRGRGDDSSNMPEILAALSRAVEEEIRGSKGLFGLETGVLERLKGGVRVTPFLRHGSVRRRESAGAAPHGLAAGGMKKWWRCPRCHVSQVRGPVFSTL